MSNADISYIANCRLTHLNGSYRFQYFCSMCDFEHTTDWINAANEDEARAIAEKEARTYFNGCHKCGQWICDGHFNMGEMMCADCAPLTNQPKQSALLLRRPPALAAACVAVLVIAGMIIALAGRSPGADAGGEGSINNGGNSADEINIDDAGVPLGEFPFPEQDEPDEQDEQDENEEWSVKSGE